MSERSPNSVRQNEQAALTTGSGGLLQRKCACGNHTFAGGQCAACSQTRGALPRTAIRHSGAGEIPPIVEEVLHSPGQPLDATMRGVIEFQFSRAAANGTPISRAVPGTISRLTIGQPGDRWEQEAEAIAEAASTETPAPGVSIEGPERGYDFSRVRIHTDAHAGAAARAVNALAYTVGNHIVFGPSQYAPSTDAGRKLLAHELVHTLQQAHGPVALNRQDAGQAADAGAAPGCPESRPADFCQPFASLPEARTCRQALLRSFIPVDRSLFGDEVAGLWQAYLSRRHGESLARRVFADPGSRLVQGFINSETTASRQRELANRVIAALPANCPALPPNIATSLPVTNFLTREDLDHPINFNRPFEIPGHIAGGVGSSDAGPDLRRVSGQVTLRRDTDAAGRTTGVRLMTNFNFLVQDAIDFCPGDIGAGIEQGLTVPLSRLEMTGQFASGFGSTELFAYDMPFEVRYTGNPIDENIDLAVVQRCFPDADAGAPPAPTPPPVSPPPAEERPERRPS